MVRIAQGHDAAAVGLGAVYAQRHRLFADDLAVTALAVQCQQRTGVEDHPHAAVGFKAAFEHRVHITRQHAHAVRVVTAQVGQHQVGRDACGFFGGTACRY